MIPKSRVRLNTKIVCKSQETCSYILKCCHKFCTSLKLITERWPERKHVMCNLVKLLGVINPDGVISIQKVRFWSDSICIFQPSTTSLPFHFQIGIKTQYLMHGKHLLCMQSRPNKGSYMQAVRGKAGTIDDDRTKNSWSILREISDGW